MLKRLIESALAKKGYEIKSTGPSRDMDSAFIQIYEESKNFTMTSTPKMFALYQAVRHIVESNIQGDLVECGVWKGGSAMVMAKTLLNLPTVNRNIWLYDTYTGMSAPSANDYKLFNGKPANETWEAAQKNDYVDWCYAPLEEVKKNLLSTGFSSENLHFIKGKVEETLPEHTPSSISLLRIDTDFYESTKHIMETLFPLLQKGGVLLLDDYGSWHGAKVAVDEYLQKHNCSLLLNRIDTTSRIAVKM